MNPTLDPDRLERTLAALVRLDSTNPSLEDAGGAGEAAVADYMAQALREIGLDVDVWDAAPGRPNVVGLLRGSGGGRSLMFNAHTDTVGTAGMEAPFEPVVRGGRMYGRGTQDMKASLAAHLAAARALAETDLPGDVVIAAVVDEEHRSLGTEALLERHGGRYRTDGAVVTEPTDLSLAIAHKGFVWIDIETHGRAAHGSRPDEGIDANMHMGRVLARLEAMGRTLRKREEHPLVGGPSLHAATLRGGSEPSVYTARCTLRLERRTLPGEPSEAILAEVQAILNELRAADDTFDASAEVVFERTPLETPRPAPIVEALRHAAAGVLDAPPAVTGASFWTDAALLDAAGTETVVFGPVGAGLHTTEEWVDLNSVAHLAGILVGTARRYCG